MKKSRLVFAKFDFEDFSGRVIWLNGNLLHNYFI